MEQPPRYVAQGECHPRCVSYDKLFMGSSRVHALGFQILVVFSLPLASYHELSILPSMWMIFF